MSFRHILFPVDFSGHARAVAPAVAAVARHDGARVTLIHSLDMPYGELGAAPIEGEIERARLNQRLRLQEFLPELWTGIETARVEAYGKPGPTIAQWATDHHVDLIMMPTQGFSRFRPLLLGSVTAAVLHDALCPVWTGAHLQGDSAPEKYRCVLCAIDASPKSSDVLAAAGRFARDWDAALTVVHSVPAVDERFYSGTAERAHRHLVDLANRDYPELAREASVDASLEILEGDGIVKPIIAAAAARQADLLVVGRGASQGVLGRLRTHAHELIRTAPCPVLSV
ncbi:MAG: universal stress protein [Bryobacteraceae bacterium]